MQPHHTLMVKLEGAGKNAEIVDHKAIPNNEWAKYRRSGWEFATPDQVKDYEKMVAEQATSAEQAKKDRKADDEDKGDGPVPKEKKAPGKRS